MDPAQQTPNLLSNNLGKRWRAERNFWISFLCFTLWWCATHHHKSPRRACCWQLSFQLAERVGF